MIEEIRGDVDHDTLCWNELTPRTPASWAEESALSMDLAAWARGAHRSHCVRR
jgi:hypothetical protein